MQFITDKKKRKVIVEIDFEDGNVRNCKVNEGKTFNFKEERN